jgi:hypothetical protein
VVDVDVEVEAGLRIRRVAHAEVVHALVANPVQPVEHDHRIVGVIELRRPPDREGAVGRDLGRHGKLERVAEDELRRARPPRGEDEQHVAHAHDAVAVDVGRPARDAPLARDRQPVADVDLPHGLYQFLSRNDDRSLVRLGRA